MLIKDSSRKVLVFLTVLKLKKSSYGTFCIQNNRFLLKTCNFKVKACLSGMDSQFIELAIFEFFRLKKSKSTCVRNIYIVWMRA